MPLVCLGNRDAFSPIALLAASLCVLASVVLVLSIVTFEPSSDLPALLRAARLVAVGMSPYTPTGDATHHWLYAPWLAFALVPMTWIPPSVLIPIWHTSLALAMAAVLARLARTPEGLLAAIVLGAFGFHAVWAGHFEPLLVALLVFALPTRFGPAAVGIAASIKVTPIVLVIYWIGRGNYMRAGLAVVVAVGLWAPAVLYGLDGYGIPVGYTLSILGYSVVAWAGVATIAVAAAWKLAPTRYGWLAASVAWLAVMPRVLPYDVTGVMVGVADAPHLAEDRTPRKRLEAGRSTPPSRRPAAAMPESLRVKS